MLSTRKPGELVFVESPHVSLCGNTFINVPVVLQYENTRLIEIIASEPAGFTTQISIYHPDGTYLAKVKGSQIYGTEEAKKAGLEVFHYPRRTVCELDGHTLFELHRTGAAALKTYAELYTPDGRFVKCDDNPRPDLIVAGKSMIQVGGVVMSGNVFSGVRIGVLVRKEGSVVVGSR